MQIVVSLLARIATERVIIALLVAIGDVLVKRTTNQLDDELWVPVKDALKGA